MLKNSENQEIKVNLFSQAVVPLEFGDFNVQVYNVPGIADPVVIGQGLDKVHEEPIFVRIHSECFTGEALGSLKCDCKGQLDAALKRIQELGRGLVIYLRQEGRGIGLGNKIKAYALQNQGLNTVEANQALGFDTDLRDFSIAGQILKALEIKKIALNTNNPHKIKALSSKGIEVAQIIPSHISPNRHNISYLKTKQQQLGHTLGTLDHS